MFILKVTRSGQVQQSDFKTEAEAIAHFEYYKTLGYWGAEEFVTEFPEVLIEHEEILEVIGVEAVPAIEAVPAVLDVQGVVITPAIEAVPEIEAVQAVIGVPAWTETIPAYSVTTPCEYTYTITEEAEKLPDVTPRQIRTAMLNLGLTEEMIDSQIATMPSPDKEQAMIAWKHSTMFQRSTPLVAVMGSMLGMTEEQIDSLWASASVL